MSNYQLIQGDCIEKMRELPDNSIDSIVTDPPYELGFMGKSWDASGIAYNVEMWKQCLRVLKSGGHLLAFGGSRTYHRMTCAIEDAGFEIRDQMMWVYGSGFPKSHNISKALDKAAGAEREVVGKASGMGKQNPEWNGTAAGRTENSFKSQYEITAPATDAAKQWDGWGTALKPAHEPICVARKPLEGTVAANVLKWGVGGLNIDACRIEYESSSDKEQAHYNALGMERLKINEGEKLGSFEGGWKKHKPTMPTGRFPANLIHDGSQEVLDLFPESNGGAAPKKANDISTLYEGGWKGIDREERIEFGKGSAARFFYCPKASKKDRDEGCEGLESKPFQTNQPYGEGAEARAESNAKGSKNNHPTVKPTELMRYLCRLVTPKGGTVLDPFNGSGSTGKAAMLEGFKYIGIEQDAEYIKIAEARIKSVLK